MKQHQLASRADFLPQRFTRPQDSDQPQSTAVVVINANGSIDQLNPAALALLQRDSESVLGRYYEHFFSLRDDSARDEVRVRFTDPVLLCLVNEQPCMTVTGEIILDNGQVRLLDGTVSPVYNASREVRGAILALRWRQILPGSKAVTDEELIQTGLKRKRCRQEGTPLAK